MAYEQALVTGGAGFIGSHLVEALLGKGCGVNVIDDLSTGHLRNLARVKEHIAFFQGDIRDPERLAEAARGCDVVFHQAAVVSVPKTVKDPMESAQVNDLGTLRVLETARESGVRKAVLASSCAVYGDDPQLPKRETLPPRPKSPYAVHKLVGEFYARLYTDLYGLDTTCLRYFNVYGPRQDPFSPYSGVISIFMERAVRGEPPTIYGDGMQYRDFVFVEDVVQANLLAAEAETAAGKVYNVGTGAFVHIADVWKALCERMSLHSEPDFAPPREGDVRESVADVHRAREELGFEAQVSFAAGLDETLKWYKKHASAP